MGSLLERQEIHAGATASLTVFRKLCLCTFKPAAANLSPGWWDLSKHFRGKPRLHRSKKSYYYRRSLVLWKGSCTSKAHKPVTYDLSIASTKTKYIKLNAKTQNICRRLNKNLTTFLYTLTGGTRKQKEIFFSFLKCIQKSNVIKKIGF